MKRPIFTGSATALVTPFDNSGELDLNALGSLIDWQVEEATDALVVCATTGECSTLSDREWEQVVDYTLTRVNGRVPVIAGVGRNDTRHTAFLCKAARKLGAQGVLAVTPYYNKTTQAGLLRHYTVAADSADIPMLLYNVPSRTGMSVTAETYSLLAEHPNIYGVKEASGDFSLILKTRALCPENFAIYSGNDDQIVPILALGGIGVISTMANVIPKESHEICALWREGKRAEAAALQISCQPLIEALFREVNPIPVKAALAMMGKCGGYLRQPLTEIGPTAQDLLKKTLFAMDLI